MSTHTQATEFLSQNNISFSIVQYNYAPQKGHIGEQAAHAINAPTDRVFKTLVAKIDRKHPVFVVLPVLKRVDFKKLATTFGGRNAKMMQADEAYDRTGFVSGGTTPFGSRQTFPVILDESALRHDTIWINAGAQGLLACLDPKDIQNVTEAMIENISI